MTGDADALAEVRRLTQAGAHAAAETAARALLDRLPDAAETAFLLAYAVHSQGRPAEAEPLYELALRYAPRHVAALNNLAAILRRSGRHEAALERYRAATRADPDKSWVWSNYARALDELGRRPQALAALKRAVALAPDDPELNTRLAVLIVATSDSTEAALDRAQATAETWRRNPAMRDFDRMGFALRPYVERLAEPDYRSDAVTTDRHGFRRLVLGDETLGYDDFVARPGPKGAICGASQALGYGVPDAATLQARLSGQMAGGALWYSLAAPISQILQQRLIFELFAPADTRHCVVLSGTFNVMLALVAARDTAPYPPLHNIAYDWTDAAAPPADRAATLADGTPTIDIETAFARTRDGMRANIAAFGARCRALAGCRFLFCKPPVLSWTGKPVAAEEKTLCDLYRVRHPGYVALVEEATLRPRWDGYFAALREAVAAAGGTWLDAGADPAFTTGEALFCDQFHLNPAGIEVLAGLVARWAEG